MLEWCKRLSVVIALCGIWVATQAPAFSPAFQSVLFNGKAAATGFQGLGDAVSGAKTFWSCARAYNAAYVAGGPAKACLLRDTATGTTTYTMNILATGIGDFAGAAASAACATSCVVQTMYDQIGNACAGATNCDITHATLSRNPVLNFSALGGRACPFFNNIRFLQTSATLTVAQPLTVSAVAENITATGTSRTLIADGGVAIGYSASGSNPNTVFVFAGGSVPQATATDGAFHALQFNLSNVAATSSVYVDGSANAISLGAAGGFTGSPQVGANAGGSIINGIICEMAIYPLDFSLSGRQAAANSNQHGSNGYNF